MTTTADKTKPIPVQNAVDALAESLAALPESAQSQRIRQISVALADESWAAKLGQRLPAMPPGHRLEFTAWVGQVNPSETEFALITWALVAAHSLNNVLVNSRRIVGSDGNRDFDIPKTLGACVPRRMREAFLTEFAKVLESNQGKFPLTGMRLVKQLTDFSTRSDIAQALAKTQLFTDKQAEAIAQYVARTCNRFGAAFEWVDRNTDVLSNLGDEVIDQALQIGGALDEIKRISILKEFSAVKREETANYLLSITGDLPPKEIARLVQEAARSEKSDGFNERVEEFIGCTTDLDPAERRALGEEFFASPPEVGVLEQRVKMMNALKEAVQNRLDGTSPTGTER